MSDLLIFLLMMPPFPNILHEAEIGQALLELIKNLDKKTGLAFFSAFTALEDEQFKQKIEKETLTEIKIYLDHWNRAANCMLEWSKELIRTWKELIKEDISADDLLNITIILLPIDNNLLKKIQVILNNIAQLEPYGEIAYIITTLHAAVSGKLASSVKSDLLNGNPCIAAVIEELKIKSKINEMIKNCESYKKFLYENIKTILNKNPLRAIYYLNNINLLNSDQFINELIEAIQSKMLDTNIKKSIHILIKKYLLIDDMLITLTHPSLNTWRKQIAFAEKFIQHGPFLKKNKLSINFLYWFYTKTCEDHFLEAAEAFTEIIKKVEAEKTINSIQS